MNRAERRREARLRAAGPQFGRLTKRDQREVLELRGRAAQKRLAELDAARREKVRVRSAQRREKSRDAIRESARRYARLDPFDRSLQHPDYAPEDPRVAAIFWKEYKKEIA